MKSFKFFALSMLLLFSSFSAMAASFTIDTNSSGYSTFGNAQGVGVISEVTERQAAMYALVGRHNTVISPNNKIKNGDIVTFKWQDGSSEKANVVNILSTVGVVPVAETQSQPSGGGIGYTNGPGGNSFGGVGVTGFTPIYTTVQICIGSYCWQSTVVSGYQYIYGNIGPMDRVV